MAIAFRCWNWTFQNPEDGDVERLLRNLKQMRVKLRYYIVAFELGEKGGRPHYQCMLWTLPDRRMTFNSVLETLSDGLDVTQIGDLRIPKTNVEACYIYCKKDGDYYEWGQPPVTAADRTRKATAARKMTMHAMYAEAEETGSVKGAMAVVKRLNKSLYYGNQRGSIERNFKREFAAHHVVKYSLEDFDIRRIPGLEHGPIHLLFDRNIHLWGPKETGKTSFALAHFKRPLFVSHIEDVRYLQYPDYHDGIVFDECNFSHWPPETVRDLVDFEHDRMVHARYENVFIPSLIPKIFISNKRWIFYAGDCEAGDPTKVDALQRDAIMSCIDQYHVPTDLRVAPETKHRVRRDNMPPVLK